MKPKFSLRGDQGPVQPLPTLLGHNLPTVFKRACVLLLLLTVAAAHAAKVEDFVPQESIFYLQLQDIDEVYGEIEVSENWEKVLALLPDIVEDWQEVQQGIAMAEGVLSTDILSLIETVAYRTGLAIWLDETLTPQLGLLIHSGGNLSELQRFTKIVEGLVGMSGGTLRIDAGVYQRVPYNAMEMPTATENDPHIIKYGFVDEFLVLGSGEGAFEKLMDTYRKDAPSIRKNQKFTEISKKLDTGIATVFVDIPNALTLIDNLDETDQKRFAIFQSLFARLNLLETGPFLQISAQFDPNLSDNEIGLFLKEGEPLKTPSVLSGEDDLFLAITPGVLEGVWELARTEITENATSETYAGITFIEGLLNLDLEEDIMTGLTGELALSVPDFTHFDPQALENLDVQFDGMFSLDADAVETNGAFIFSPTNRMKWNRIGNSLSNLQNVSISQTNYNGTTVSGFASSIYYTEIGDLFLMGFLEEQVYTLVDAIKAEKKLSYLKQMPKTPVAFVQLNVARALEIEKGAPPSDKVLVDASEILPLLTWLSVEGDEVLLEARLLGEEIPLEVLAKLTPFLLWNIEN